MCKSNEIYAFTQFRLKRFFNFKRDWKKNTNGIFDLEKIKLKNLPIGFVKGANFVLTRIQMGESFAFSFSTLGLIRFPIQKKSFPIKLSLKLMSVRDAMM